MQTAVGELERLDEELISRRDALADAEARMTAGEQRFGRALEALRSEESRLEACGGPLRQAFEAARVARCSAMVAFSEARSSVALAEGVVAAAAGPGIARSETVVARPPEEQIPDEALSAAYSAAGKEADRVATAAAAERAARRGLSEWESQLADALFQIEQLVANSMRNQQSQPEELERSRQEIAALEERRSELWQKLIGLASSMSGGTT